MRLFAFFTAFVFLSSLVPPTASAQGSIDTSAQIEAEIADLLSRVEALRVKLKALPAQGATEASARTKIKIEGRLSPGSSGEQVRLLQQLLASDPALYPEGLITGFYGPKTGEAVKRFQAKLKLEQVGVVGPLTIARINEILVAAGVTTEIPTDLLSGRVKIEVKIKDGQEVIKIQVKEGNSGEGSVEDDEDEDEDEDEEAEELEIEVEVEGGRAYVDVEREGTEESFTLRTTDRDEIIEEIAELLGLPESEVEAVIEIEYEDEDEEEDD